MHTEAQYITAVMKDILFRCLFPITQYVGQAYDGASGVRNGVQALMKKECERALYVQCLAHCCNLFAVCYQEMRHHTNSEFELIKLSSAEGYSNQYWGVANSMLENSVSYMLDSKACLN